MYQKTIYKNTTPDNDRYTWKISCILEKIASKKKRCRTNYSGEEGAPNEVNDGYLPRPVTEKSLTREIKCRISHETKKRSV
jgi:hypothetical protein